MYIIEIDIVRSSGIGITLSIVSGANSNWKYPTSSSLYFSRLEFSRGRSGGGLGEIRGRSYEELLEEVLGKQVLQIIVDAVVLVRRAGLAHAQYRKAEVLNLDARFGRRSFRRVVAALRVSLDPSPPMIMMIAADRRPTLRFPGTPTIPADFILPFHSSISRRSFSIVVTSIYIYIDRRVVDEGDISLLLPLVHGSRLSHGTSNVFVTPACSPSTETSADQRRTRDRGIPETFAPNSSFFSFFFFTSSFRDRNNIKRRGGTPFTLQRFILVIITYRSRKEYCVSKIATFYVIIEQIHVTVYRFFGFNTLT